MTCTCTDHAKKARQLMTEGKVKQVGRNGLDLDGNHLCIVDSFGFRGPFQGECDDCYKKQVEGYKKAMAATFDDDY